jgi:AraC-like DNA-binding protein
MHGTPVRGVDRRRTPAGTAHQRRPQNCSDHGIHAYRLATATLPALCRSVGMSERSLRRHFLKIAGITWEEYRQRLRICHALDLLERTTRQIGDIGTEIGYENQAAFARAFRSVVGMTPSEYRRQQLIVLPTALAGVIS